MKTVNTQDWGRLLKQGPLQASTSQIENYRLQSRTKWNSSLTKNVIFKEIQADQCLMEPSLFSSIHFETCEFINVSFTGARFSKVHFRNCEFRNVTFGGDEMSVLEKCAFERCKILHCQFDGVHVRNTEIVSTEFLSIRQKSGQWQKCTLKESKFTGLLRSVGFVDCCFTSTDLRDCKLHDCSFPGSAFEKTVLPNREENFPVNPGAFIDIKSEAAKILSEEGNSLYPKLADILSKMTPIIMVDNKLFELFSETDKNMLINLLYPRRLDL